MGQVLKVRNNGTGSKRAGRARAEARARSAEPRASLYDEVTARIVAELEAGRFPWVQPWDSAVACPGLPRNAVSGRSYSGVNVLILWGELIALRQAREAEAANAPVAAGIALNQLNFGYSFSGDRPDWRPVRAFDDGVQVYIEFPETIAVGEMPPLFVIGAGGAAELVNYRVSGRYMIVDRLFSEAELRMGDRKSDQRVRIRATRWRASA